MERTNSFLTFLVAVVAAWVVAEGSSADPLIEPHPDLPLTQSPSLPPLAPIRPPAPSLPPAPLPLPPIPAPAPFAPAPTPPDTPCYPALHTCKNTNTSDPSKICCDNLKTVYKNGTDCICKVVESPELSKELGLNATDVSNLLLECKITNTSIAICTAPAPAPNEATIVTTKLAWISTIVVLYLCFLIV